MKIIINYSSKLSNSFSEKETKKNKVVSLGAIQESIKNEKVIITENDTYEDVLFKINKVHPNFNYNPISKGTVEGVLARLLGETRYLDRALKEDADHIIHKLSDKITFDVFDRNIFNEIIRVATPEKEVQNNGAGVVKNSAKNHILLSKNKYSELLYSIFNLDSIDKIELFLSIIENSKSIKEIKDFFIKHNLNYKKEFNLIDFLNNYNDHVNTIKSYDKHYRDLLKKSEKEKISFSDVSDIEAERYILLLKKFGRINKQDEKAYFTPKFISLTGVLLYTLIDFMISLGLKSELVNNLIEEKNNNIKGIAVLSGGLTIKDFYSAFVESKKTTSNSPYFLNSKFFNKKENKDINQGNFNLGATKEDGVLEINIDVSEEDAIDIKKQIDNVGVSTFQLGKKGLAYVKEINIYD